MSDHQGSEEIEIRVLALRDSVPPFVRLRRLLKVVLCGFGFRRVSCRDVTPRLPDAPPTAAQDKRSAAPSARKSSEEIPW
jgi:hypothetical protein